MGYIYIWCYGYFHGEIGLMNGYSESKGGRKKGRDHAYANSP